MVFIISTICRARWIIGVVSAKASRLPARMFGAWQPVQSLAVAAANIPIVSMNSSTGMPLSTWMFLKTVSAMGGFCPGAD